MKRHILDKPRSTDTAIRLREFLRIGRAQTPHSSSLILQRRTREQVNLLRFVTIARTQTT